MMKIRLIFADMVKNELALLDRAESDRDTPSKQLAIAAAKKCIRDNLLDQMELFGKNELHEYDLTLCKKYFRDVGENCFVFTEQQMQDYSEALKARFYQLREGETLDGMKNGDSAIGDGDPWTPEIKVKGGSAAFYSIGVGKGE